jgi:hypothetical protein
VTLFLQSLPFAVEYIQTEINGRVDPLRWPRDTLYPQKKALTSPTSGGHPVGIVRLRTTGHGVFSCIYSSTRISAAFINSSRSPCFAAIQYIEHRSAMVS